MRRYLVLPLLLAACVSAPDSGPGPGPRPGAPSGPPPAIATAADAQGYVLRVVAENGCTMSLDAFEARRAADGLAPTEAQLAGPGGIALLQTAALVDAAPFALISQGLLVEDAADSRIVTSRGAGCA